MAQDYVITVTSLDRVGIIATVSEAVLSLNGNVDALSQTVMEGYFTLILTTHFDKNISADRVKEAIELMGRPGELGVQIRERTVFVDNETAGDGEKFILTITGSDRKGVITRVTNYLAGRNVNIEDLYARAENGNFLMVAELMMPPESNVENMQLDLDGLWPEQEFIVTLQHENIFLATNQVDFQVPS